jgi:hypothetical protein
MAASKSSAPNLADKQEQNLFLSLAPRNTALLQSLYRCVREGNESVE